MTFNFVEKVMCIGGAGNEVPTLQFYKKGFVLHDNGGSTPSWQDIILSGNTALTLVNAKANGLNYVKIFGATEQRLLPDTYQLYTSVEANGITYEYSSQNLTQIPCKRIADNVFGLYNYTTKVFISEV